MLMAVKVLHKGILVLNQQQRCEKCQTGKQDGVYSVKMGVP